VWCAGADRRRGGTWIAADKLPYALLVLGAAAELGRRHHHHQAGAEEPLRRGGQFRQFVIGSLPLLLFIDRPFIGKALSLRRWSTGRRRSFPSPAHLAFTFWKHRGQALHASNVSLSST